MAEDPASAAGPTASPPNAAQPTPERRSPGWREVLLVGAIVVAVVLGLAVLTSLMPLSIQDVVFRTPLAIVVLVVGTVGVLVWITRRPAPRA